MIYLYFKCKTHYILATKGTAMCFFVSSTTENESCVRQMTGTLPWLLHPSPNSSSTWNFQFQSHPEFPIQTEISEKSSFMLFAQGCQQITIFLSKMASLISHPRSLGPDQGHCFYPLGPLSLLSSS